MTQSNFKKSKNYELCADIIAAFSLLEKFGFDEITGNLNNFTSFLNEVGFKSSTGQELTPSNLSNLFRIHLSQKEKEALIEEFNTGYKQFHLMRELVAHKVIH